MKIINFLEKPGLLWFDEHGGWSAPLCILTISLVYPSEYCHYHRMSLLLVCFLFNNFNAAVHNIKESMIKQLVRLSGERRRKYQRMFVWLIVWESFTDIANKYHILCSNLLWMIVKVSTVQCQSNFLGNSISKWWSWNTFCVYYHDFLLPTILLQ